MTLSRRKFFGLTGAVAAMFALPWWARRDPVEPAEALPVPMPNDLIKYLEEKRRLGWPPSFGQRTLVRRTIEVAQWTGHPHFCEITEDDGTTRRLTIKCVDRRRRKWVSWVNGEYNAGNTA